MATGYVEYHNIVSGYQPISDTSVAVKSAWIDMKTAHEISFLVQFGAVTGTSTIDGVTVTVEASTTNDSTTATAVAFKYRVSGAVTANTWGAVTDATATGYAPILAAVTGTNLFIQVDPAQVQATVDTARWLQLNVTKSASVTACTSSCVAFINPRYKQVTMVSAT
jgi:hypothetical protein